MGELLQGPWARRSDDEAGDRRAPVPAPPGRRPEDAGLPTSESGAPSVPVTGAGDAGTPVADPRWAIPGVDADEPLPLPEPAKRSRRAEHIAVATLTRHDASEGEVRAKLTGAGLPPEEIEGELERLRRAGLIDDEAFAARQVRRLREQKGLGDGAIRSALRGRFVPPAVIDAVLADAAEDEESAEARLQQAADDRARRLTALPYPVAERRLAAFLMRKGYSGSAVRGAVRTALESAGIS